METYFQFLIAVDIISLNGRNFQMSENKGKTDKNSASKEEIDDFAQALLDKKTEMALFKNMPKEEELQDVSERKQAERQLSSALDMLRKERGQLPIEEEERRYTFQRSLDDAEIEEEEDFTTYSLGKDDLMNASLKNIHDALDGDVEVEIESKSIQEENAKKEIEKEPKKKKEKLKKVDPNQKKRIIAIIACIVVVLGLMGAYAYKLYIYDPQNVATEAQLASYDKLVACADEWDMMSDAEKLEILDLKKDYDSLLDKQKTEINSYFKEQTGKTFNSLYKELKALSDEQEDEQNPDYQEIVAYLTNWSSKTDDEKMNVVNLKTKYDALTSSLQKKIDDLSREQTQKSFGALFTEYQQLQQQKQQEAEAAQQAANNEQIAYYQSLINQYNVTLQEYTAYATTLQQDLQYAQSIGQDTTEIQSQIDTNNQLISQTQSTIAYYQQLINELQ